MAQKNKTKPEQCEGKCLNGVRCTKEKISEHYCIIHLVRYKKTTKSEPP